jgi:1,4-dihydroxy-2-naphthoate octaprenyltransferase
MLIILIPLLVTVVGALIYALSANPKLVMMGLIMFAVGLFWTVRDVSDSVMSLGSTTHSRHAID